MINVWDERAGKSSSSCTLHDQRINTIDFHPENTNCMATSSSDGTACIWDLRNINANRPESLKMVDHKKAVHSAYFSPSGNCLATTSANDKVGLIRGMDYMDISMVIIIIKPADGFPLSEQFGAGMILISSLVI